MVLDEVHERSIESDLLLLLLRGLLELGGLAGPSLVAPWCLAVLYCCAALLRQYNTATLCIGARH